MFNRHRLNELLGIKNWTAYKLSKESGVSQATISEILNGKIINPNSKTISKISIALNVPLDYFFNSDDELNNMNSDNMISTKLEQSNMQIVGNKIKQLREYKNLSTYDLSELTGISQSTISKLENNKRKLDVVLIEKIAKALGVNIAQLLESKIKEQIQGSNTVIWENDKIPDKLRGIGVEYITIAKELEDSELTPEEIRSIFSAVVAIKKDKK